MFKIWGFNQRFKANIARPTVAEDSLERLELLLVLNASTLVGAATSLSAVFAPARSRRAFSLSLWYAMLKVSELRSPALATDGMVAEVGRWSGLVLLRRDRSTFSRSM